jgi:hypothetical protein
MKELSSSEPDMPSRVRDAATLLQFLTVYATAMSVPLSVLGAFASPPMFYAGMVHVILAVASLLARQGLLHRRRWARWLMAVLALIGMPVFPIFAAIKSTPASLDDAGMIFPLIISLVSVSLLWVVTTPTMGAWFAREPEKDSFYNP